MDRRLDRPTNVAVVDHNRSFRYRCDGVRTPFSVGSIRVCYYRDDDTEASMMICYTRYTVL